MNLSIKDFWLPRFATVKGQTPSTRLAGWNCEVPHVESFVEADLSLRQGYADLSQNVWLIAAPGAVGKSTLARQICASSNAVYLDLATAATVAGNYLVGGLVNAGLWDAWRNDATTLLVDALDEARLRVTQSSFEDFLVDVAHVATNRSIPIILLGRVGIVEEAWTILNENCSLNPPIFDIELFQPDQAKAFVLAGLKRLASLIDPASGVRIYPHLAGALDAHKIVYSDAAQFVVDHVANATSADGRQFAGYAPVLEAIATLIASEPNPAKIKEATRSLLQGQVLGRVTSEVMLRESGKLAAQISASQPELSAVGLYGPKEQLVRLASRILGAGTPTLPPELPSHAVAAYEAAVRSLLPQHPFLDSKEPKPSGAVFAASILAAALTGDDPDLRKAAERIAGGGPNTPNPFLLDFYREALGSEVNILGAHIGILYSSLEAIAGPGDQVRLAAEGEKGLDVEMSLIQAAGSEKTYDFKIVPGDTLRFGRRVSGVNIDAELTDIEIGEGRQVELVAPISIKSRTLLFSCTDLSVKTEHAGSIDPIVYLEANEALADSGLRPPLVRAGAQLQVSWPDAKVYPWTPFASAGTEDPDPRMADAQRALRRLCISFRSHSKGRLARFKGKVEHFRMTKGTFGIALRERLLSDRVLSLEGPMYFLNPDLLGEVVGISFQDLKLKRYPPKSRDYLHTILGGLPE